MDTLTPPRSQNASAPSLGANLSTPVKAVTQAPLAAEPDPYVWLPAGNALLGQAPRPSQDLVKPTTDQTHEENKASWQWREAMVGLGIGAAIGAGLGVAAFKAYASFKA